MLHKNVRQVFAPPCFNESVSVYSLTSHSMHNRWFRRRVVPGMQLITPVLTTKNKEINTSYTLCTKDKHKKQPWPTKHATPWFSMPFTTSGQEMEHQAATLILTKRQRCSDAAEYQLAQCLVTCHVMPVIYLNCLLLWTIVVRSPRHFRVTFHQIPAQFELFAPNLYFVVWMHMFSIHDRHPITYCFLGHCPVSSEILLPIVAGVSTNPSMIADKLSKQQASRNMLPNTGQAGTLLQLST